MCSGGMYVYKLSALNFFRYSVVIDDGIIQRINVDPDHTGLACLLCIKTLKSTYVAEKRM